MSINSQNLLNSSTIILGIGLATFFRTVCQGKRCRTFAAPPLEEIEDQTYKFDGKCYKMEKSAVKCDSSKKIVRL